MAAEEWRSMFYGHWRSMITAGWKYNSGALHRAIDLRAWWWEHRCLRRKMERCAWLAYEQASDPGDTNSYGNMVKIEHTAYKGGKLETFVCSFEFYHGEGWTKVKTGEVIGYSGQTGNCFGAHLHFEVRWKGVRENPLCWL